MLSEIAAREVEKLRGVRLIPVWLECGVQSPRLRYYFLVVTGRVGRFMREECRANEAVTVRPLLKYRGMCFEPGTDHADVAMPRSGLGMILLSSLGARVFREVSDEAFTIVPCEEYEMQEVWLEAILEAEA